MNKLSIKYAMSRVHVWTLIACVMCVSVAAANAAPSPNAFKEFPIDGIALNPVFSSGQLIYDVTLSSGSYLYFNSAKYPITQVWALYAVNKTNSSANDMTANGSDIGDWKWDTHFNSVAGWVNSSKSEAILTPATGSVSKQFTYSQFAFTGLAPEFGLHITLAIPEGLSSPFGSGKTGFVLPTLSGLPTEVPEPSTLLALLTGLGGLLGLVRRKRG